MFAQCDTSTAAAVANVSTVFATVSRVLVNSQHQPNRVSKKRMYSQRVSHFPLALDNLLNTAVRLAIYMHQIL